MYQNSHESNQDWGSNEQKGTTYFKEPFLQVPLLKWHVVLIMRIINVIINIDDIKPKRLNEGPILKLNKRFK